MRASLGGGLVLLALGTAPALAQQPESLTVRAPDGLMLHATLYRAPGPAPLVLLFHQCNRVGPSTGFERLGLQLAAAGLSALALDFRGFGRSTSVEYPDFRSDMERAEARWPGDVEAVLARVGGRADLDTTRLAAVGASCGVEQGIHLAGRRALRALVALSGSLGAAAESTFAAIHPLPVFVAFAESDRYDTPRSMRALFAAAREPRSRMVTYKGASHGTPLLAEDPGLEVALVRWLAALLRPTPAAPGSAVGAAPVDTAVIDAEEVATEREQIRIEVVAQGLALPSALAFLPDGRGLLAERMAGRLSLLDRATGALTPLAGLPPMHLAADREEEGGLFDVIVHPDYARNGWIYFSYSEGTPSGNTTVVDRARLDGVTLAGRERIFTAHPYVRNSIHFGGRMALVDGYLFVTIGERNERERAQDLGQHHGKIVRLHQDGRVPKDNPFARRGGALPEIWSWGHRNPQGLAYDPAEDRLWSHEHGPRGGDEVNIVRRGANYGWPLITYGREYTGEPVGDGGSERDGLEQPVYYWLPSIAPSGMQLYRGRAFPGWQGSLLVGAMAGGHLNRLVLRDGRVIHEERLPTGKRWRVRLVSQGPEGAVYLGTDAGYLLRLTPARGLQPPESAQVAH